MTHDEFMELEAPQMAEELNKLVAEGKSKDEAAEAFGISKPDLMKAQVFFVKDKYIARAWGGYTSTKRTGNEKGDSKVGEGQGDPSRGFNGI